MNEELDRLARGHRIAAVALFCGGVTLGTLVTVGALGYTQGLAQPTPTVTVIQHLPMPVVTIAPEEGRLP